MPESIIPSVPAEPPTSPFNSIMHEDEYGEYWLARELQILMGYEKWENFDRVIERAIRSAENTATYSDQSFSRLQENVLGGGPARINYRLNRHAAYLVAMNGEPNKPQVAAAQAYFAAKTREAELATGKPMSELEVARKYLAVLERELALSAELEVAKPKAGKWDAYLDSEGLIGMTELADLLKVNVVALTYWFIEVGWFRKQASQNGTSRNLPRKAFQDSGHFVVKLESKNGWNFQTAYATPQGVDLVVDSWGRRIEE